MATPTLPTTQLTQLMLTATQHQLPSLFDDSDDEELMGIRERRVGQCHRREREEREREREFVSFPFETMGRP